MGCSPVAPREPPPNTSSDAPAGERGRGILGSDGKRDDLSERASPLPKGSEGGFVDSAQATILDPADERESVDDAIRWPGLYIVGELRDSLSQLRKVRIRVPAAHDTPLSGIQVRGHHEVTAPSFSGLAEGELDTGHPCQRWKVTFDDVPADVEVDAEVAVDGSVHDSYSV